VNERSRSTTDSRPPLNPDQRPGRDSLTPPCRAAHGGTRRSTAGRRCGRLPARGASRHLGIDERQCRFRRPAGWQATAEPPVAARRPGHRRRHPVPVGAGIPGGAGCRPPAGGPVTGRRSAGGGEGWRCGVGLADDLPRRAPSRVDRRRTPAPRRPTTSTAMAHAASARVGHESLAPTSGKSRPRGGRDGGPATPRPALAARRRRAGTVADPRWPVRPVHGPASGRTIPPRRQVAGQACPAGRRRYRSPPRRARCRVRRSPAGGPRRSGAVHRARPGGIDMRW